MKPETRFSKKSGERRAQILHVAEVLPRLLRARGGNDLYEAGVNKAFLPFRGDLRDGWLLDETWDKSRETVAKQGVPKKKVTYRFGNMLFLDSATTEAPLTFIAQVFSNDTDRRDSRATCRPLDGRQLYDNDRLLTEGHPSRHGIEHYHSEVVAGLLDRFIAKRDGLQEALDMRLSQRR